MDAIVRSQAAGYLPDKHHEKIQLTTGYPLGCHGKSQLATGYLPDGCYGESQLAVEYLPEKRMP